MRQCPCANKQKRRVFHAKMTSAKLYIYIGVGSRDLFINEAHMALGIFPVFFPACCLVRFAAFYYLLSINSLVDMPPNKTRKKYKMAYKGTLKKLTLNFLPAMILTFFQFQLKMPWIVIRLITNKTVGWRLVEVAIIF